MGGFRVQPIYLHKGVVYMGSEFLNEYEIQQWTTYTELTRNKTRFAFTMAMRHLYISQLTGTFFQTAIICLLAYGTLFFGLDHFGDRVNTTLTAMLVIVSLLGAQKRDIPQTAYFKFIDLWFLVHVLSIFIIFIHHVMMDFIIERRGIGAQKLNTLVKLLIYPTLGIAFYGVAFGYLFYSYNN